MLENNQYLDDKIIGLDQRIAQFNEIAEEYVEW